MPVVILLLTVATFRYLIGKIDVAWRPEVVARHEQGGQSPQPRVRNGIPGVARQEQRMEPNASVRRGDTVFAAAAPGRHDAVDRPRIESGPVAQYDDGRLHFVTQRSEPASQRGAGPTFPLRAVDDARVRGDLVRAEDDHEVGDLGALAYT
jgi:hypothetical protein